MAAEVFVQTVDGTRYTQDIKAGKHVLTGDEPESVGGNDRGPTPDEWLLASLGSGMARPVRMYAARKEWDLQSISLRLRHDRIHADDCSDCETKQGMLDEIHVEIEFGGDLDSDQRQRLLVISQKCPVHRTLTSEVMIRTSGG